MSYEVSRGVYSLVSTYCRFEKSYYFYLQDQKSRDLLDLEVEGSTILGNARNYVKYEIVNIS